MKNKNKEEFNRLMENSEFIRENAGKVIAVYNGQVVHSGYVDDEVIRYAHAITGANDIYFGTVPENKEDNLSDVVRP